MPTSKFSFCIMNPPYDNKLHLRFLEKSVQISNEVVSIQPIGWLIRLYKKILNNIDSKLFNLFNIYKTDVEMIEGNDYFDVALSDQLGIFNINMNKKENGIDIKKINDTKYYHFENAQNINLFETDTLLKDLLNKLKTGKYAFEHIRCTTYLKAGLKDKAKKYITKKDNLDNCWVVNMAQIRGHQYNGLDDDFYTWIPADRIPEKFKVNNSYLIFPFNDFQSAKNFISYLKSDFARSVLYFYKNSSQLIPATDYLPWFDFSDPHFSKSTREIDDWLFDKYDISDEIRKHIEEILPDYYNIRK